MKVNNKQLFLVFANYNYNINIIYRIKELKPKLENVLVKAFNIAEDVGADQYENILMHYLEEESGCCKKAIKQAINPWKYYTGNKLSMYNESWFDDDFLAIIANYSSKYSINNKCLCGRHGINSVKIIDLELLSEYNFPQYGTNLRALSHVQGQDLNVLRKKNEQEKINAPNCDMWCDIFQKERFDPKKCREQYNGKEMLIYDVGMLGAPINKNIISKRLKMTTWSSRGWTWQEAYLAKTIMVYIGGIDITEVCIKYEEIYKNKDDNFSITELFTRDWTYKSKDLLWNLQILHNLPNMTYADVIIKHEYECKKTLFSHFDEVNEYGFGWLGSKQEPFTRILDIKKIMNVTIDGISKHGVMITVPTIFGKENVFNYINKYENKNFDWKSKLRGIDELCAILSLAQTKLGIYLCVIFASMIDKEKIIPILHKITVGMYHVDEKFKLELLKTKIIVG